MDHPFRKDKKNFMKGKVVKHSATPALTGAQIHEQLKSMQADPNRPGYFFGYNEEHAWTHKPCIWDLPYFEDLLLPQTLTRCTLKRISPRPFLSHFSALIRAKIIQRLELTRRVFVIGH